MQPSNFDELTKALATSTSRRQALRTILGASIGGLLGLGGISTAFGRHHRRTTDCNRPGGQKGNSNCANGTCCGSDESCFGFGGCCQTTQLCNAGSTCCDPLSTCFPAGGGAGSFCCPTFLLCGNGSLCCGFGNPCCGGTTCCNAGHCNNGVCS